MTVAVNYDDALSGRRQRLSDAAQRDALVFEKAYAVAGQVMELREQRGLTQKELAVRAGLHQADVSRIERGSSIPTERTLIRLADALDADVVLVARSGS